jgi:hypothetical protein
VAWMVPYVPDGERGSGSHAIAYVVALTPLRRILNQSQPGWLTSSRGGKRDEQIS